MYVRPPSSSGSKMKLPENYGGNAFSQKSSFSDIPVSDHPHSDITDLPESEYFHKSFKRSTAPNELTSPLISGSRPQHMGNYANGNSDSDNALPFEKNGDEHNHSIFSSLLPGIDIGSHFPFGHGIGGEELLILAVMFLVYLSGSENGKTDNEFILLLGLLLFAG